MTRMDLNKEGIMKIQQREREIIGEFVKTVNKVAELFDVIEYLNNLEFEDTKVKITVQQQNFKNGVNTSYEKIILD